MMMQLTVCLFGILLGIRHAFEPDHLTALSTMVTEERGPRRAAALGALWGIGHTGALLAVGLVLALLQARMPARLADTFELAVAVMLVALGARAIRRAIREGRSGAITTHSHGRLVHEHAAAHGHLHIGGRAFGRRSLLVGVVHGLAGSGSLTALALANLPTTAARLLYVALFGAGSIAGMAVLSGLAGWPLARVGRRPRLLAALTVSTGLLSVGLGISWGWPLVFRVIG
jgi:ABC-type nickel/cobalt efflux system permease component RcnA